jgi:hypothetical protein
MPRAGGKVTRRIGFSRIPLLVPRPCRHGSALPGQAQWGNLTP